ncbi:MAG: hypothetical protein L6Q54_01505 [Leptospiraceae bacterium]|nr:hypothetical protein [Leptospiraceae bacterium]MCK6379916.1 hypothetical protein [Leptospiraceae bacterium]NUM40146.1 hypothetical protein [Leptospiraceae bacterium]
MEKLIQDIVNAGIAIFKSGETELKNSVANLEKLFNEMKTKGETDQSEQAVKIRELLNKTVRDAQEVINKADSGYKEIIGNLQTNFDSISKQIETAIPPQVKTTLQTGLDELKKLMSQIKK